MDNDNKQGDYYWNEMSGADGWVDTDHDGVNDFFVDVNGNERMDNNGWTESETGSYDYYQGMVRDYYVDENYSYGYGEGGEGGPERKLSTYIGLKKSWNKYNIQTLNLVNYGEWNYDYQNNPDYTKIESMTEWYDNPTYVRLKKDLENALFYKHTEWWNPADHTHVKREVEETTIGSSAEYYWDGTLNQSVAISSITTTPNLPDDPLGYTYKKYVDRYNTDKEYGKRKQRL